MTDETLWTIDELADKDKVSDDTIRRRMKELGMTFSGRGRLIRIPDPDANKILARVARLGRIKKNNRG